MSVANILFMDDRILCLSDSMVYSGGEAVGLCETKCRIHPGGRFATVTRGLTDVADVVDDWLADHAGDIEEAEAAIQDVLALAADVKASTRPDLRVEATLMGWSDRHRDLRIVQFRMTKARPGWDVVLLNRGLHLHPDPGAPIPPPPHHHEAAMVKLALAQRAVLDRRGYKDMCIGGVMHLTTVTAGGVTQRIADTYPDYDADSARFGDPNAAEVAAFRQSGRIAA